MCHFVHTRELEGQRALQVAPLITEQSLQPHTPIIFILGITDGGEKKLLKAKFTESIAGHNPPTHTQCGTGSVPSKPAR